MTPLNEIIQGDVLAVLAGLPDESVHCVVTSPPYWGLRDYGIDPMIWDGDADCEHKWGGEKKGGLLHENRNFARGTNEEVKNSKPLINVGEERRMQGGQFCLHCNAWLGSYGLEPTMDLYLQHTVQIFREIRRVLRKDGVCFLNIGDSYNSPGPNNHNKSTVIGTTKLAGQPATKRESSLKPKDLCLIPARVALALQADGWWVRSQIIWAKGVSFCKTYSGSVMPESCRDRPTKAYELVYLLTKSARYYYDSYAVREEATGDSHSKGKKLSPPIEKAGIGHKDWHKYTPNLTTGRNLRDVWTIKSPTDDWHTWLEILSEAVGAERAVEIFDLYLKQNGINDVWTINPKAFKEAHFATFPPALVSPMIKAGTSEAGVCAECGSPYERVVEKDGKTTSEYLAERGYSTKRGKDKVARQALDYAGGHNRPPRNSTTIGWRPTCSCNAGTTPAVVLDPFMGSGTVAAVAKSLNRHYIGIEISPQYIKLAEKRISAVHPKLELV